MRRYTDDAWCMVVSVTFEYNEPTVEKGYALVRHFQPKVIIFACHVNDCFVNQPTVQILWFFYVKNVSINN